MVAGHGCLILRALTAFLSLADALDTAGRCVGHLVLLGGTLFRTRTGVVLLSSRAAFMLGHGTLSLGEEAVGLFWLLVVWCTTIGRFLLGRLLTVCRMPGGLDLFFSSSLAWTLPFCVAVLVCLGQYLGRDWVVVFCLVPVPCLYTVGVSTWSLRQDALKCGTVGTVSTCRTRKYVEPQVDLFISPLLHLLLLTRFSELGRGSCRDTVVDGLLRHRCQLKMGNAIVD